MRQHPMVEFLNARPLNGLARFAPKPMSGARFGWNFSRLGLSLLLLLGLFATIPALVLTGSSTASAQGQRTGPSGLPLPRFVSLKSDRVNVRRGPGRDYEVDWVFVRSGVPVEIVQEFDNWRKIRDWEGAEGWVFHSLLTGRRTAIISPWESGGVVSVRKLASGDGDPVAYLEPRVVASVQQCNGYWCLIEGERFGGWIEQTRLWGVYPEESIRP